ncbi:MAG: 6,7-dimethyl-8-ribityllumazine synthase [Bacteroidales bacterium]
MATADLSNYDLASVPSGEGRRVAIVVSEWNIEVTGAMLNGAKNILIKHGVEEQNIDIKFVPGTFELTFGAKVMMERGGVDGIIVIGCVVRGGTPHFEYVCQGVTQGIAQLNAEGRIPIIYGVLTTDNEQQALDRAGGMHGNKGDEAAVTLLKMLNF